MIRHVNKYTRSLFHGMVEHWNPQPGGLLTLREASDGPPGDYVEMAEHLGEVSEDAALDLAELWRRMAFSVAIHNTDDHLRNYGLVRGKNGWRLSPAFDVTPNSDIRAPRTTGIGGATNRHEEIAALMDAAPYFGLCPRDAIKMRTRIEGAVSGWQAVASSHGVGKMEFTRFAGAFSSLGGGKLR